MRVLEINAVYGMGSTGTIVRDLQDFCAKDGIECHIAYSLARGEVPNGYKIGGWLSHKIHALLSRISGKQGYFSIFATIRFLRYLQKLNPDVVHLHNLHSNYINVNMLLRFLAKNDKTTVITLHDCWWFTGGCFHYTAAGCDRWLNRCGNCPKRMEDTPAYLCDSSVKILNDRKKYLSAIKRLTIVGVSSWISSEARKTFLKGKRIETIYNGVDSTVFKPSPSNLRERLGLNGKFIILGPASKWLLTINKSTLEYFVRNMKNNMVLVLYGLIDTKINVSSNTILYGYTHNREELAQLYSMADVFVNPTREDSLGFINIEAQFCGTPAFTYKNTGVTETVPSSNSVDLNPSGLFHVAISSKSLDKSFLEKNFSQFDNYRKYIELYKSIVK